MQPGWSLPGEQGGGRGVHRVEAVCNGVMVMMNPTRHAWGKVRTPAGGEVCEKVVGLTD